MKRLLLIFGILTLTTIGIGATLPGRAHAVDVFKDVCKNASKASVCKDNKGGGNPLVGKNGIITEVINLLSRFVGVVAVIAIIVSGLMMTSAGGDAGKVSTAKRNIGYAVAALVIAVVAQMIVAFILNTL